MNGLGTCKRLNAIMRTHLYTNVCLYSPHLARSLHRTLCRQSALAETVRRLDFRYNEDVCADASAATLLPLTPNLLSLAITSGGPSEDDDDQTVMGIPSDAHQLFSLFAALDLSGNFELKNFLPKLQSCSFDYTSQYWSPGHKSPFFIKPGLTSLSIDGIQLSNESDNCHDWYGRMYVNGDAQSDLTSLTIVGQVECNGFEQLLSLPPALTHLNFHYRHYDKVFESGYPGSTDVMHYWRAICRHKGTLEQLEVLGPEIESEAVEKPVFSDFPRLRTLRTTARFLGDESKVSTEAWSDVVPEHVTSFALLDYPSVKKQKFGI